MQLHQSRWVVGLVLFGWCAFIFGTSCTVIMPHDFFAWIARNVLTEEASFSQFALFWGLCWFGIVKGWHAFEFGVMCALAQLVLNRRSPSTPRRNIYLAAVFSLVFAASDEYHQTFVPERGGTIQDTLIDSLGIGLVTIVSLRRLSRERRSEPIE